MSDLYITTFSGKNVSLLNPEQSQIDIADIAHGLAYQSRFNGQTSRFYSIAQHCLLVASILPDHLKLIGLLHDAAEAYLGDIVQPLKQLLPEFNAIEDRFLKAIGTRLGVNIGDNPMVKEADLIALATEKRDLLLRSQSKWPILDGITPLNRLIQPMSPEQAETAFIKTLLALREARIRMPLRAESNVYRLAA